MNSTSPYNQDQQDHGYGQSMNLILVILSFIFLFVGVFGNAAVIIYNVRLNHDRTLSSWMITNLAIADLLVCLTIYPMTVFLYFSRTKKSDIFDKLVVSTLHVTLFLSTTMLLSITVDRYVFIKKPLRYHTIVTSRRMKVILSAIWLISAVQIPIMFTYSKEQPKPENNQPKDLNRFLLSRIILLSILIVIIAILNYKMLKVVQKQRKWKTQRNVVHPEQAEPEQMQPQHDVAWLRQLLKQMRAVKTFTIIFGVLTVCFVPYFVLMTLWSTCFYCFTNFKSDLILLSWAHEIVGISSIANAFIYALRHRMYLRAYKKLFSAFWERVTK